MATTDNKQSTGISNPWKGLNFYKEGEILYGRDDEIQSLALYVTNNIQTVLYGKSGIGKSSIINAGVFPIARKEGLFPVPIRLKHDKDTSYIAQIKSAIQESGIGIREILTAINEQNESLWEFLHRNSFYNGESNEPVRPLIVFDQFEEIFTLQQDENKKKDFFSELANLLNEVTPQYIVNANNDRGQGKNQKPKIKDSSFVLDLGSDDEEESKEYVSESLFNIVFTIREDFLSYLERYTKFIPVMKSNRYALLPLNEEQAKDIIMKPVPGLADIDVAKLIIQKVTGQTDFNLNDAPEIDVDAAVLSLYLSRLYEKKGEDGSTITAELVDESSKDIIKDFYEESVSDLPISEIEKIEDQLLTYEGRRNNVSRNDLIREGVSKGTIYILVEERKLLRQFSYQNDIRVEFIHDILCPIVNNRISHREQLAKERDLKKKNWMVRVSSCLMMVVLLAFSIYECNGNKNDELQQGYLIVQEDSTISLTEYWKANVIISIGNDTILHRVVDKVTPSCFFQYNPHKSDTPQLIVKFLIGNYNYVLPDIKLYNKRGVNVEIPIYRRDRLIPISGKVISNTGENAPVFNALVIIGENITKTDEKGLFTIFIDSLLYRSDKTIRIIKNNYDYYEGKIMTSYSRYQIRHKGKSLFPKEANDIKMTIEKSLNKYHLVGRVYTYFPNDTLYGNSVMNVCIENNKVFGYFYYIKNYNKAHDKYNAYFLFQGDYETRNNSFRCTMHDAAFNSMEMKGTINKDGTWAGKIYVFDNVRGAFSFK